MTEYDKHFFEHFDIDMKRVGIYPNTLKSDGVGVLKYKTKNVIFHRKSSLENYISTFDKRSFYLMVFLDQYRDTSKALPDLPEQSFLQLYHSNLLELDYDNNMYKNALRILRDTNLTSYSQLTKIVLSHKNLVGDQYINSTHFGENIKEWYFGDKYQYDGSRFELNSEGFWDLMHIEKGNGRAIMTFYDVKYVYQYLLKFYFIVL